MCQVISFNKATTNAKKVYSKIDYFAEHLFFANIACLIVRQGNELAFLIKLVNNEFVVEAEIYFLNQR